MPKFRVSMFIAVLWLKVITASALGAQAALSLRARLTIATVSGETTFHIGERIPLVLSFTGPDDRSYAIDLAHYDRSGRMYEDSFSVEPQSGWADPLQAYFRYGSYMGGGLRGGKCLSSKPQEVLANLNEWVRFDEPGTYVLTVTSHRVGPTSKQRGGMEFPTSHGDLTSANSIALTITPATPDWQERTLRRILRDLPKEQKPGATPADRSPTEQNALDDLRFLTMAPALRVLAAGLRFDRETESAAFFGLLGVPEKDRGQALTTMRPLLSQPDFPVSEQFLEVMSWLHMPEEREPLPSAQAEMRAAIAGYEKRRLAARDVEWRDTASSLHWKEGAALEATETALLEARPAHPDPVAAAVLGATIRRSFAQLSPADQARMLDQHWDLFGSRELLPQLRTIAKAPPVADDAANPFFSPHARIAIALRRWYELEPENASVEAMKQIGRAYPQLSAKEVSYLPSESLPQFEPLWAKTLANGDDFTEYEPAASLLLRFGTGAVSAQMSEILRHPKDHLGNRLQPALAYLVKFDPGAAQVLLERDPTLFDGALDSIAKHTSPCALMTHAALRQLTSSDPNVVADALAYLRHFGDVDVREPIYEAFLLWYERNKHLVDADLSDLPQEVSTQLGLGGDLVMALLANQGWMPDAQLMANVFQHTVGSGMRSRAEQAAESNLDVTVFGGDFASYEIGLFDSPTQELFEAKLDQFPKGTQFNLQHVTSFQQHDQDQVEASLPELFQKHGMTLLMSR